MVDMPIAVLRFALYADLTLVFGVPLFWLYGLCAAERRRLVAPWWPWVAGTALLGAALSVIGVGMLAASMAGVSLAELDHASIDAILWHTSIGTAALARVFGLLAAALLAFLVGRLPRLGPGVVVLCAAIALGSLAWTGHGAMDEGTVGWLHLIADIAHLIAAGAWIGAIVGFALLLFRPSKLEETDLLSAHRALDRFAVTGVIFVTLIVATGIVNSWLLVGPKGVSALPTNLYGQLLIAKLVLFTVMLFFAAANRFRLTPRLADPALNRDSAAAVRALRLSLLLEAGTAFAVLAVVAWLGMIEPPALG